MGCGEIWQGVRGWTGLLKQRKDVFLYLKEKLEQFCLVYGERVLSSPGNPVRLVAPVCQAFTLTPWFTSQISIAVSLSKLPGDPKMFGSMAFSRGISGLR